MDQGMAGIEKSALHQALKNPAERGRRNLDGAFNLGPAQRSMSGQVADNLYGGTAAHRLNRDQHLWGDIGSRSSRHRPILPDLGELLSK
jgi:hypothetical protein